MTQQRLRRPAHGRQRGQSTMEYVVTCAALAVALFLPVPGSDNGAGSRNTIQILLDGFEKAYQRFTHSISLPT
ncbi:hypothetical protein LK540_12665 [Massilia sp. IC2-278]|uniref:hypothetical protein n=1 Tax=Massilia sp. IC2-278 TaxID=2887200 RepID=UPI001E286182|nr:hypothetical protein [Massilia sp. IC2-278]MCC2961275.1 hypothetical protein [Massilia sp. IC2-278]